MADSLSRLRNPRAEGRPEPKMEMQKVEPSHQEEGDHHHAAAESLHDAEPESKHMIVSHDGYGMKSHGIHEDGRHEPEHGTQDHENIEDLKSHLGKFFGEEEQEGQHEGGEEPEEHQSLY